MHSHTKNSLVHQWPPRMHLDDLQRRPRLSRPSAGSTSDHIVVWALVFVSLAQTLMEDSSLMYVCLPPPTTPLLCSDHAGLSSSWMVPGMTLMTRIQVRRREDVLTRHILINCTLLLTLTGLRQRLPNPLPDLPLIVVLLVFYSISVMFKKGCSGNSPAKKLSPQIKILRN